MRITRRAAIEGYEGLLALEQGPDGKPYNLEWSVWDKIFRIMAALQPVKQTYGKARQQRFLHASEGAKEIKDGAAEVAFTKEEDAILDAEISVKMPKDRLTDAELRFETNKIPPSVRMLLRSIVTFPTVASDDDDNEY